MDPEATPDASPDAAEEEGRLLREHLFEGDLLSLPEPGGEMRDWLPEWFAGELPCLVYPPLAERGLGDGDQVSLQITPYHIFYGALRELAETTAEERSAQLSRLVLGMNPNAALDLCDLAHEHVEDDPETALLHFELAMELDPNLYQAIMDAGTCLTILAQADDEESEERLEHAAELFRRGIELRPNEGFSWWSLARVLDMAGEQDEAEACLRTFLEQFPAGKNREMAETALANGFVTLSDDGALFMEAQNALPEDPARAAELVGPLAQRHPDSWEPWFVLGSAHRRLGDAGEAERCLRRAARLAPEEAFVWWELGQACEAARQWSAAEEAARRAVELDPENAGFLCLLGRSLLEQGDREGAAEAVHRARELVPDDPEVVAALNRLG